MTRLEVAALTLFTMLVVAFGMYSAMAALPPASYWFEVDRLEAQSAEEGQPIVLDYARTIKHPFEALWRVEVWRLDAYTGGWESYCVTPEIKQRYRVGASLPEPVTLEWFAYTSERCHHLPSGTYYISGEWTINPDSAFRRRVGADSPPFIIRGDAP